MKVYVLYRGEYDEDGIVGVFSSKEKAMKVGLRKCDSTASNFRYVKGKCVYDKIPPTLEQVESRIYEYELDGEEEE